MRGKPHGVATVMVGACAADGFFYAFNRLESGRRPVWRTRINAGAHGCQASADLRDNALVRFFQAGDAHHDRRSHFAGSIRKLDTSTGHVVWQTGLRYDAVATASMDGANVLAVGGCGATAGAVTLLNRLTGAILKVLPTASGVCTQPVFADGNLLVPTRTTGLIEYHR